MHRRRAPGARVRKRKKSRRRQNFYCRAPEKKKDGWGREEDVVGDEKSLLSRVQRVGYCLKGRPSLKRKEIRARPDWGRAMTGNKYVKCGRDDKSSSSPSGRGSGEERPRS